MFDDFWSSSEKTEIPEQQIFFNEAEHEFAEKSEEPVKKIVKVYKKYLYNFEVISILDKRRWLYR